MMARPTSRRGLLGALAVAPAMVPVVAPAAGPDPVLVLLAAEQAAWDALTAAYDAEELTCDALKATGYARKPSVTIGSYRTLVEIREGDGWRVLDDKTSPSVVHSREEIAKTYAGRRPGPWVFDPGDGRRVTSTLWRDFTRRQALVALKADEAAISSGSERQRVAMKEAHARSEEAGDRHREAFHALMAATPTTGAGLLAMLDVFERRDGESYYANGPMWAVFAAVRSFVNGRA